MTERELLQKLVKTYFTNNCGENVFNLMKSAESLLATPPAAALAPVAIPEWRKPRTDEHPVEKRWREDAEQKYGDLMGVSQAVREYLHVVDNWNRPYNSEMSDRVTNADLETAEQLMLSRIRAEAAWFSGIAAPTPSTSAAHLPCPICNGVEGCDHSYPERERAVIGYAQLMTFYSVDSIDQLITAMEGHIEKLQRKLPQYRDPVNQRVREG